MKVVGMVLFWTKRSGMRSIPTTDGWPVGFKRFRVKSDVFPPGTPFCRVAPLLDRLEAEFGGELVEFKLAPKSYRTCREGNAVRRRGCKLAITLARTEFAKKGQGLWFAVNCLWGIL